MDQRKTKTLCPYCGVGCGLEVSEVIKNEQPTLKVMGDRQHPSSLGKVCVKGATIAESLDQDRLLYPMYRRSLQDQFQRISWDDAFELIVEQIKTVKATLGSEGIAMYGSGQLQTKTITPPKNSSRAASAPTISMPTPASVCPLPWRAISRALGPMGRPLATKT